MYFYTFTSLPLVLFLKPSCKYSFLSSTHVHFQYSTLEIIRLAGDIFSPQRLFLIFTFLFNFYFLFYFYFFYLGKIVNICQSGEISIMNLHNAN